MAETSENPNPLMAETSEKNYPLMAQTSEKTYPLMARTISSLVSSIFLLVIAARGKQYMQ